MIELNEYFEICVLTHNRIEFVSQCLSSIINHTKLPYKLIVLDNASTDGTREYLQLLEKQKLIHKLILNEENTGIAEPKNALLKELEWKSNFFVMTDSDIVFPYTNPCWAQQMIDVIKHHPKVGVLCPNLNSVNVPDDTKWWFEKQNEGHRQKKEDLITLESGFWGAMITKEAIDVVYQYNEKKYGDHNIFRCRSKYGETDEMFRQALQQSGRWCGVARNLTALNLGWDDKLKFSEYHMFKKIERSKAEQARREEEK